MIIEIGNTILYLVNRIYVFQNSCNFNVLYFFKGIKIKWMLESKLKNYIMKEIGDSLLISFLFLF